MFQQAHSYRYIQNYDEMIASIKEIQSFDILGVDVEFDRDRHAYGFTLCLIQVFAGNVAWLFDPFGIQDLSPLYSMLENPDQLKIMHAPGEDLQLLRMKGCRPMHLFDTERAARLLDYESFSLSSLLSSVLGVEISKSMQKSNWTITPLSEAQLRYAAADVAWLPELYRKLNAQATEKGILPWIEEENKAWEGELPELRPEGIFYNKDEEKKLPPYQLFVYNALLAVRDGYAKKLNKPGYQVIDKHILADAAFDVNILENWDKQAGIHPRLKNHQVASELKLAHKQAVAEAAKRGLLKFKPESRLGFDAREAAKQQKLVLKEQTSRMWNPFKEKLASAYGEFASAYMFSEKTYTALTSGELSPDDLPFAYRRKMIKDYLLTQSKN